VRSLVVILLAGVALWTAPGAFAAGWCGPGEASTDLKDATTGRQIHAIWAVPADGADTFAAGAPKVADDLASIEAWWQGQDPTRVPRIDDAAFPSGTCEDISFVRLPDPSGAFVGAGDAYDHLALELTSLGFANPFKKYLVYYDGPSVQNGICGTGGGDFATGPSYAIVWLAGCPGVPTDSVAAHELLHALGALPDGAPHPCPGDTGHPCDSTQDVLYPYNSGAPLQTLYLDWNHDDYYGHSGSWPDIQDSLWLHLLDVPELSVTVGLSGAGSVTSDVPGIDCAQTCTTQWDSGSSITLTAQKAAGSRFVGWSGACHGRLPCALSVGAPLAATATFGPLRIPLSVRTTGRGTVRCTPRCRRPFPAGAALTLRAVPGKSWRFVTWTGDCAGVRVATCRPRTDFHVTARAGFRRR
jgi:hypothetical protein